MSTTSIDPRVDLELEIDRVRLLVAGAHALEAADLPQQTRSAAMDQLVSAFGLDEFERLVLLMCAGFELDPEFGRLCAQAFDGWPAYPTFGLAAAVFPGARTEAFLPGAALRRWRLVELSSGASLTTCPVHLDERVMAHLLASNHLDSRLAGMVRLAPPARAPFAAQAAIGHQVAVGWQSAWDDPALPPIQVSGHDPDLVRSVSAHAAHRLGLGLLVADAETLPAEPRELDGLARLWWREAELEPRLLVLDGQRVDHADAARWGTVRRLIDGVGMPVLVETDHQHTVDARKHLHFRVPALDAGEQRQLWVAALDGIGEAGESVLDRIVSQYRLPAAEIAAVAAETKAQAEAGEGAALSESLWIACRTHARPRLGGLAQRIEPRARWSDLVLPPAQLTLLRLIALQVVQRYTVHERWGFGRRSARGLGLASIFVGPSGTGKTMAAEVVAGELGLDLYRVDLSQVVNKYIGETEKNLGRIFDAADAGAGILLFDEADALFGKRSEVRDSHDRYANIETGYLLQRMEDYRGLAILTTNMKESLDAAFMRRLRFLVEFPFPDAAARTEIWRRIFPEATPTADLDFERLGQLNVAGGSIKNIALNAAFLAAGDATAVSMSHILASARLEAVKLQHPLTSAELRGWS